MLLDGRLARLMAVAASVAANCQPCLATNIKKALECQADHQEVAEAIAVGRMVREGAASRMDRFIAGMTDLEAALEAIAETDCECRVKHGTKE